jgi:hypothetical protein
MIETTTKTKDQTKKSLQFPMEVGNSLLFTTKQTCPHSPAAKSNSKNNSTLEVVAHKTTQLLIENKTKKGLQDPYNNPKDYFLIY